MTTKAHICTICGEIYTGEGAKKVARKCEKQGKPGHRWKIGQVFLKGNGKTLTIAKLRVQKGTHLPEYTLMEEFDYPRKPRLRPMSESLLDGYVDKHGWTVVPSNS